MTPPTHRAGVPPVLVFTYGNPSRGDDALGPEFARRLEDRCFALIDAKKLEVQTDFQLQIEHVLDLVGRNKVFFVDASAPGSAPFTIAKVHPARDASFTTHLLSPAALLHTWDEVVRGPRPDCWVVAIAGSEFELGAPLSDGAEANLSAALAAVEKLIVT
jgi:hydrogenase maturation protease